MKRRLLVPLGLTVQLAFAGAAPAQVTAPGNRLIATEPQTAPEYFDAAVMMLKLSRPELARQYLASLLQAEPDEATLFAIREKHGTAAFVQMSQIEELQPESTTLLNRLNSAARSQLDNEAFRDSVLNGLMGTPREREAAFNTLHALEDDAAPLVLKAIAAGVPADREPPLRQALLQLGPSVIPPLEAALSSSNAHLQAVAADLLGRLEARSAELSLLALAFNPQTTPAVSTEARRALARLQFGDPLLVQQVSNLRLTDRLKNEAELALARQLTFSTDETGKVPLWMWIEAAKTVELFQVSVDSATLQRGDEWSRAALRISPDDPQARALVLAHYLWREVREAGWDQPIPSGPGTAHDFALTLPPELVEQTLSLGIAQNNSAVTIAAIKVLSQTGSRTRLLTAGSPLLTALDSGTWRVQFAAAEAVLMLDPQQPFAGSGRVVEILARALHTGGVPKTVVIDPNTDRGAAIAGMISNLGYRSGLAPTGRQGFEMAAGEGDVELAVVHLNTVHWDLSQTLANLRTDPRTKRLPIAVYGPRGMRSATWKKMQPYQLVAYFDDQSDAGQLRDQLTQLLGQSDVPELTEAQRIEQTRSAAFWLRHISEGDRTTVFPLEPAEAALVGAASNSAVSYDVLVALGAIGKPSVQQRMAEIALATGIAEEDRRVALVQLAFHLQKFGRMLDNATVEQLESGFRQIPPATLQSAWASVIGALQPTTQSASRQLLGYPLPQAPLP